MAKLREEYRIYDNVRDKYLQNGFCTGTQYARIWKNLDHLKKKISDKFDINYKHSNKDKIPDSWILCSYSTETGYKEMKIKDLFNESNS